jgi:beta-lactam-binding protein with PASTA domain
MIGAGGSAATNLVDVPSVVGLRTADAQVILQGAGFQVRVGAAINAAPTPANVIAAQSPSGKAPAGSVITLTPSNGKAPVVQATPTATPSGPSPSPAPKPTRKPKPHDSPHP